MRRILLTGSGGPFRTRALADLAAVTPDEACAHPTWSMGRKISVDSATMMNKALEIIEAHWLFGAPPSQIEVVVHPQSVVHSMVEYADGSVIAQLGHPDMRTPIAQALAYPERIDAGVPALDLGRLGALTFEAPDFKRFRALALAYDVLAAGGTAPAIFNAANEVAVAAFLRGELSFVAHYRRDRGGARGRHDFRCGDGGRRAGGGPPRPRRRRRRCRATACEAGVERPRRRVQGRSAAERALASRVVR